MKSRAMNWGMGALLLACWSVLAVGCKPACARGDEAACLQLLEYVKSDEDGKREESVEKLAEACLENSEPACNALIEADKSGRGYGSKDVEALLEEDCNENGTEHVCALLAKRLHNALRRNPGVAPALRIELASRGNTYAARGCKAGHSDLCNVALKLRSLEATAREEQAEIRKREQEEIDLQRALRSGTASDVNCEVWAREPGRRSYTSTKRLRLCTHLVSTIREGRTSTSARQHLQEHLRDRGLSRINGYIIAQLEPGVYEAVMRGYDSYFRVSYPRGKHFILKTKVTEYRSKGTFRLWVTKTGTVPVDLNSGFKDTWDVYEESPMGELWQGVRSARAGHATSEAARTMLRYLR